MSLNSLDSRPPCRRPPRLRSLARAAAGVLAAVAALGPLSASAQADLTSCVLSGPYVLSGAVLAPPVEGQLSGQFVFSPPLFCAPGAAGTVELALQLLISGDPTPIAATGSVPYTVDASGALLIGPGIIAGAVGGVADGIANAVVFEADPAISPATLRFAGTAVRVELAAPAGTITGVTAGAGLTGGGTSGAVTLAVNTSTIQVRVTGSCAAGQYVRVVNADGTVTCGTDANSGGTIAGVTAGTGLTGGGTSGTVTLAVNSSAIQARVTGSCAAGQYVRVVNADGTVTCGADANSGGTVTSVGTGAGLLGGPITTTGTLSVDTSTIQARVTGGCPAGQYVQAISATGGVSCGTDANSGGTVTSVGTGPGLTGGPVTTSGMLAVDFGGPGSATTVARSDHTHAAAGFANTAVGAGALQANTGVKNTAVGASALLNNTTGAANTAVGLNALGLNITGADNTAVGAEALVQNTTGTHNTAVGAGALQNNTTGTENTASGWQALLSNTTGFSNTASGVSALFSNTIGVGNTATGDNALFSNTSGDGNTASGFEALRLNTSGGDNTATGLGALTANTTGTANTATGARALFSNTTGGNNTATGFGALTANTIGANNIAIGADAGMNATTGDDNIYVGHVGVAAEASTIRIGTQGVQAITFIAGISGVTTGGAAVAVLVDASGQLGVTSSSRRVKDDIRDMGGVSDSLLRLRPVTFRYKQAQADGTHPLQYGLIAEEVAEVYPEMVQYSTAGEPITVLYHLLPAMLLNEIQKQRKLIQAQQTEIRVLSAELAEFAARLARLERLGGTAAASLDRTGQSARLPLDGDQGDGGFVDARRDLQRRPGD